jgi:VIT1/CCC1 family predicted Fe2+/Mn2+ transporter
MAEEKLFKRGQLGETPQGEKLLVNDKGIAYLVSDPVIAIWSSFKGNTAEEVVQEIAAVIGRDPSEVREPIMQIISQLKEAELLASGE